MLRVNEIFHSIQGESTHAGRPCVFVRLTGCPLRCVWCDTAYAFHEGSPMAVEAIVEQVLSYGCPLVEVTGGEPLAQPRSIELLHALVGRGLEVMLETSGALPIGAVPSGVRRIVDVKCPGSGEAHRNLWGNLDALREGDEIKFVLAARSTTTGRKTSCASAASTVARRCSSRRCARRSTRACSLPGSSRTACR